MENHPWSNDGATDQLVRIPAGTYLYGLSAFSFYTDHRSEFVPQDHVLEPTDAGYQQHCGTVDNTCVEARRILLFWTSQDVTQVWIATRLLTSMT
jgi:hypothetical protein